MKQLKPVLKNGQKPSDDDLLNLKLPSRIYNLLRRGKVTTISQLAALPEGKLSDIRSMGKKTIEEIKSALEEYQRQEGLRRSLYQCFHARVKGAVIRCARKHSLSVDAGTIEISELARGKPLIFEVCQDCRDYYEMGPPVPLSERGWNHL